MKKQLRYAAQGAVGLLALGTAAVQAQAIQSVEIEGTVTDFYSSYYYNQVPTELENAVSFKFVVEQDTSVVPYYVYSGSSYEHQQFQENLYNISYTFYDAAGAEITAPASLDLELTAEELFDTYVYAERGVTNDYEYMQWWGRKTTNELNDWNSLGGYINNSGQQPLFAEFTPYPLLLSATSPVNQQFGGWLESYGNGEEDYYYLSFYGTVTSILATELDADGDGFADSADSCPASLMDETVMFDGWLNSGVTNYVDASGCAIMDHYAACAVAEAEEPTSPWGWFQPVYSGPTYCEKQVVYQLQNEGVIDYTEGRMLRNALSLSYSSEGPR